MSSLELIKKLRQETGAGVMDCKKALEENGMNYEEARRQLSELGLEKAKQKSGEETKEGLVYSYVHATGKVGALVVLACETDFVSRTDEFKNLVKELAMQVAAMKPESVAELLDQVYIRDNSKKVRDLLVELTAKVGENIVVKDFKVLEV